MIMQWISVDAATAQRVRSMDEESFFDWLDEAGSGPASFDVDKAWHAVHFTLTGDAWAPLGPFGQIVFGGEPFGEDVGYGPPRLLSPEAVVTAARALAELPPDQFESQLDFAALQAHDIYPSIWDREPDAEELVEYVRAGYAVIRDRFTTAAGAGEGFVTCLT